MFLFVVYLFLRGRLGLHIPLVPLALVFVALQVDALGNYFRMYGQKFGPLQYDEFSHMTVQVLIKPLLVWLIREGLEKCGYQLPIRLTAFFSGTLVFSLAAFYEIIRALG